MKKKQMQLSMLRDFIIYSTKTFRQSVLICHLDFRRKVGASDFKGENLF